MIIVSNSDHQVSRITARDLCYLVNCLLRQKWESLATRRGHDHCVVLHRHSSIAVAIFVHGMGDEESPREESGISIPTVSPGFTLQSLLFPSGSSAVVPTPPNLTWQVEIGEAWIINFSHASSQGVCVPRPSVSLAGVLHRTTFNLLSSDSIRAIVDMGTCSCCRQADLGCWDSAGHSCFLKHKKNANGRLCFGDDCRVQAIFRKYPVQSTKSWFQNRHWLLITKRELQILCNNQQRVCVRGVPGMATQVPGADNQSTTDQGPQISGPDSETSVSRHVDLNLNLPTPNPTYNPFMLMQQVGPQSYPSYQISDAQQHYDQQGYIPSSIHGANLYTAPQEVHYGYQGYHPPVQEQMQGYTELQQQNYMQPEDYVQGSQTTFENRHQGSMQRILPRRLPHVRQRIRRRNRTNRGHISHIHSVAADMAYNNREHSTATSITGTSST